MKCESNYFCLYIRLSAMVQMNMQITNPVH